MRRIKNIPTDREDPRIAKAAKKALEKALASFRKHRGTNTESKQIRRIFEAGRSFEAQIAIQGLEAQAKLLEQYEKEVKEVVAAFTEIHRVASSANKKMTKDQILLALGLVAAKAETYSLSTPKEKEA